jgi:hypothetical protein
MKPNIRMLVLPAMAVLLVSAGCNTDMLWADRQEVDGPVTDLDSPEGIELPDIQIADANEVDLAEQLLMHRAMYHRTLRALRDYYRDHGYEQKRRWAEEELRGVERIQPFRYLLSAEVPADDLKPIESIASADAMYAKGQELMRKGGHGLPALYRQETMLQALNTFVDLIRKYPSSDKIDDAAFWCGEIHKEYLEDQAPIAVKWYERSFTWDPNTPHPARFQAAVTYDFRMHDRARALELYRQVIEEEDGNKSNVSFAVTRIDQLTEGGPTVSLDTAGRTDDVVAVPTAATATEQPGG